MSTRLGDNPLKRKSKTDINIVRKMYKKKKTYILTKKIKSKPKSKPKPKKKQAQTKTK